VKLLNTKKSIQRRPPLAPLSSRRGAGGEVKRSEYEKLGL